jgi:hypothetical protein
MLLLAFIVVHVELTCKNWLFCKVEKFAEALRPLFDWQQRHRQSSVLLQNTAILGAVRFFHMNLNLKCWRIMINEQFMINS